MEEVLSLVVDGGCDGGSDGGVVLVVVSCSMIEMEADVTGILLLCPVYHL